MSSNRDNRQLKNGAYYHIYNRGNRRELIVHEPYDYHVYEMLMYRYFKKYHVELIAYCFMPNHFHFLIRIGNPNDYITCIRNFSSSSARYYNRKYGQVGHLFQDKYKHRLIGNDLALIYLSYYIHRNPLELRDVGRKRLLRYPYSSILDYCPSHLTKRSWEQGFVKSELVMKYFRSQSQYRQFLLSDDISQQIRKFRYVDAIQNQIALLTGFDA